MEELENTNPTTGNPNENPVIAEDQDSNQQNPATEQQQSTDYSQLFSENISDNSTTENNTIDSTPIQENPVPAVEPANQIETENQSDSTETVTQEAAPQENIVKEPPVQENIVQEVEVQTSEPNFDKEVQNTSLSNQQNIQTAQVIAEQRKAAIEQQKLAWLKQHESKAKKSGFTSWILSGILLMLLAFAACSVFAKDQVLNAIDYLGTLIPLNTSTTNNIQNTINLPNTEEVEIVEEENAEEVDEIQTYYNKVDEIVSSESDSEAKTEQLKNILTEVMEKEEPNEDLTQYISQAINNLAIDTEEPQDEQNENTESEENTEDNTWDSEYYNEAAEENNENEFPEIWENTDNEISSDTELTETFEEENIKPYTITHVNSEEEANWVLPAHCSDLTCYWEDQEFVECTSFRMIETLDENTSRVSSRGGCKYKDPSELVYVQFN